MGQNSKDKPELETKSPDEHHHLKKSMSSQKKSIVEVGNLLGVKQHGS